MKEEQPFAFDKDVPLILPSYVNKKGFLPCMKTDDLARC